MRALVITVLAVAALVVGDAARADAPPAYVVIVHPSNKTTKLEKKTIADAFLKKRTRWGAGRMILPVDQTKKSAIRKRFSEEVLGRSLSAVRTYWNQLVFSGRGVPPPEVDSDADVIAYVLKHPGAIGYVAPTADVKGARVVQIK